MERVVLAVVLVAVALVVAWLLQRRQHVDAPTSGSVGLPVQIDRNDFAGADRPWLVLVFSSATCDSCADATAKARVLASPEVAVDDVSWQSRKDLHDRYGVDTVPATLIVDADGVVHASFIGKATATDLWAAMAEARAPGRGD